MDKVVDPTILVMASITVSCTFMMVVIIVNGVLLCALEHGYVTIEIAKCEEEFTCAIKAAKFAAVCLTVLLQKFLNRCSPFRTKRFRKFQMPMTAVVALSELSGLTMEQVIGEYDKDSMERRAIIYSVFGGRDGFTKEFIETCPKFLQDGYRDEALLLRDKL
uniref:Uncharacterized protein n=1 Tax=Parascaris equorum TaxID=6256 RepID=A0A914RPQ5_PAREQ